MIFIFILLSLIFSAFFSGIETGHYTIDQVKLYYKVESGESRAKRLHNAMKNSQVFIFTILICNNLAVYIGSIAMTSYYTDKMGTKVDMIFNVFPWSAETAATVTLMLPFFFFGEVLPKNIFQKRSNLLYKITKPVQLLVWLFLPLTIPLSFMAKILTGKANDFGHELHNLTLQKLRFFISKGRKGGVINSKQNEMIDNLITLSSLKVKDLMMPLRNLKSIELNSSSSEALEFIKKHKVNAIPLFNKKRQNIVGIVRFFDIMDTLESGKGLESCLIKLPQIPLSCNIQQAFAVMQKHRVDFLRVIDRHGHTRGLLKLKDIVKLVTK